MKYLENALKFLGKFFILAVPLYVLAAIPALIQGAGAVKLFSKMGSMYSMFSDPARFSDPAQIFGLFSSIIPLAVGGGVLAFILNFIAIPSTYGMVNKALETNQADLNDFVPALQQNFVKYILYWIGTIVVGLAFFVASGIIIAILGLLTAAIGWVGGILLVLVILALFVAGVVLFVLLSLWLPAMVVDNLDVVAAAKKSIEIAKAAFWLLLGISLLVWIAGAIVSGILSFLGFIPLIGSLILSVIPAVTGFIMTVFYLQVYRDKTGKAAV